MADRRQTSRIMVPEEGGPAVAGAHASADGFVRISRLLSRTDLNFTRLIAGARQHFARNQTVFSEGDEACFLYVVVKGGVRLTKMRLNGRRQIAGFALNGDVFGFEADEQHSLSAEALCDTIVRSCSRQHVDRLSEELAEVRHEVIGHLRRQVLAAQAHSVTLGRHTAAERVASFVLQFTDRHAAGNGDTLALPMSRLDIADYLGLTLETVCRELAALKQQGLIGIPGRNWIALRDRTGLEQLAEGAEA